MLKKVMTVALGMVAMASVAVAQTVQFYGVKNTMRYDDGDDTKYEYLGWNAETGKAEFLGDVGLWSLDMNGSTLSSNLVHYDNLMYGNSGSIYINGYIYTVMSHQNPDPDALDGDFEFVVRKWDATTYTKLSEQRMPKSANIESRGMAYNPKDGKVYGLFYLTDVQLPVPDDELDEEDRQEGYTTDAGYAICTIDLETMALTQITPGVYYDNFVTLACSPEGRLFSMTSGGTMCEFDCKTGLMLTKTVVNEYGEPVQQSLYQHSGVQSQFKRQAACFDHSTGKMYWNGYVNSGKGYNDWGSYGPLPDREWRTNGKYDTALYEVDTTTGKATKIANIPNRIAFSCIWVVGADGTENYGNVDAIEAAETATDGTIAVYNTSGQLLYKGNENDANLTNGLYIIKSGNTSRKVMVK